MQDVLMPVMIDDVVVPEGRRDVDHAAVNKLAESIKNIGLKHPITVRRKSEGYELVAGLHRIEAHKKLGLEHISACIVSMTNAEARMWEIAENLHRAELTKLQRSEQIEEWRKLAAEGGGKIFPPQPNEHGVKKTADALGLAPAEVRNAEKIANITEEAKEAAEEAGIDDNQSKLLAVARETPERQVAKVIELAAAPLNPFETQEQWLSAIMRLWNKASKEWREEFLSRVERPVMDERYGRTS